MFPLCLKHPAAIFILIFYLFQHTFSEANSTLTIQPPSLEHDPSDALWLENSAGYGGSDFYDFPKKPPYGYGGVAALHNSRWLVFTEIPIERHNFLIVRLFAVSETQFIAFFYHLDPDRYNITKRCSRWRKEDESWTSEVCYISNPGVPNPDIYMLSDQTLFVVERESPPQAWSERSRQRSALPQNFFSLFRFLPDKHLYTTGNRFWGIRSLNLLSEAQGQWQVTELYRPREGERPCDMVMLDNERLVLAINRDTGPDRSSVEDMEKHSIWIFYEEQEVWHREPLGYSDSQILGMTVQHEDRLITWHADGVIKTWNLF